MSINFEQNVSERNVCACEVHARECTFQPFVPCLCYTSPRERGREFKRKKATVLRIGKLKQRLKRIEANELLLQAWFSIRKKTSGSLFSTIMARKGLSAWSSVDSLPKIPKYVENNKCIHWIVELIFDWVQSATVKTHLVFGVDWNSQTRVLQLEKLSASSSVASLSLQSQCILP